MLIRTQVPHFAYGKYWIWQYKSWTDAVSHFFGLSYTMVAVEVDSKVSI